MHTQLKTFNLKKKKKKSKFVQFPERKTSPDNKIHQRELFQTKHEKKKKKLPAEFAVAQKHKLDPKKRKRNSRSTTAQRLA
jgi:hypothetical protein